MPARPLLALAALGLTLSTAACGSGDKGSTGSSAVAITSGDSTCTVAKTDFAKAGEVTFDVENTGKDVTEVYVYAKGSSGKFDKVVGEVENIAPGTSRDFEVDLGGGDYEVACKPGQKGDGIRTAIEVKGEAGDGNEAAYDREVEISARDFGFVGLEGFTAKVGEKIEFKLKNISTDSVHQFELLGPDGKEVGEIGSTNPGETSEAVFELKTAGSYRFLCGIGNHEEKGMKGTFTVS